MAQADGHPRAAVDKLAVHGGDQGPKARGRGRYNRGSGQQRQGSGGHQQGPQSTVTCLRCSKQRHIAQECRAPPSAIVSSHRATLGQGRPPPPHKLANHDPGPTMTPQHRVCQGDRPRSGGIRPAYRSLTTRRRRRNQRTVDTMRRRSWLRPVVPRWCEQRTDCGRRTRSVRRPRHIKRYVIGQMSGGFLFIFPGQITK